MSHFTNTKISSAVGLQKPFIRLTASLIDGHAIIAGNHLFDRSANTIAIYSFDDRRTNKLKVASIVEFKEWPKHILLAAIKKSGLFAQPEARAPLPVCVDRWHDATAIHRIGDITIWGRTLLGDHVDYCAELDGFTFHAATLRAAVSGLDSQVKQQQKNVTPLIIDMLFSKPSFLDMGIMAFRKAYKDKKIEQNQPNFKFNY